MKIGYRILIITGIILVICLIFNIGRFRNVHFIQWGISFIPNSTIIDTNYEGKIYLNNKYNAISNYDSICDFTYDFEKIFINEGKYLNYYGYIDDIERQDSSITLVVSDDLSSKYKIYISHINCSKSQFEDIYKYLKDTTYSKTGWFVMKVNSIHSHIISIPSIAFPEFDLEGSLVDFYINKREQ